MQRRAVLCVLSVFCLVLMGFYVDLFVHMQQIKATVDVAVAAQVDDFCNASYEWAYSALLDCNHESTDESVKEHASKLLGDCEECQKDVELIRFMERTHGVHACGVLEQLCHHTNFEYVGEGKCQMDRAGRVSSSVPPVILSKPIPVETEHDVDLCCELACASVVGCVGFWQNNGRCALVSPHRPLFEHTLKEYSFCATIMDKYMWENESVGSEDVELFLKGDASISETDGTQGSRCWRKSEPKMVAVFDKTASITIFLSVAASVLLVLFSVCSLRFHYDLARFKFPSLRKRPLSIIGAMFSVFFEKIRRRRRADSARKRDELLGLDYSSDEWSSDGDGY